MENDFFEEDDNIFGEDEVLDYIIYEEIEKETGQKSSTGCFGTILVMISTFGGFATLIFWMLG